LKIQLNYKKWLWKEKLGNQFRLESTTHATLLSLKIKAGPMGRGGGQGRLGQPATTLVPSSKNIKKKLVASKLCKYPIPESLNQDLKLLNHMQMCFGYLKGTLSSRIPLGKGCGILKCKMLTRECLLE
jgi:hypothetical protein